MNDKLQQLLRGATRLTQSGRLAEATAAIQRALAGSKAKTAAPPPIVIDGCISELRAAAAAPVAGDTVRAPAWVDTLHARLRRAPMVDGRADVQDSVDFTGGTHTHAGQTRQYKLYVPPGHAAGRALPLVVMLHGCTQDPDDFAAGTGMNEAAREQGFLVLYPAQSAEVNPQRCWNWFKHNHQQRDRGEPALIATMTQAVMARHQVDARRVYIAGLSSGGAMAAIVAAVYPELFAAVGVHSGLPVGAASNLPEALAAMNGGAAGTGSPPAASARPRIVVPTIVFHGDHDHTVHPRNGEQVIAALFDGGCHAARTERGVSPQGRHYTRSVHHGDRGRAVAEHWTVHGAGHAWSGGRVSGSYTDPQGPDATQEMLRFFFDQPHGPGH